MGTVGGQGRLRERRDAFARAITIAVTVTVTSSDAIAIAISGAKPGGGRMPGRMVVRHGLCQDRHAGGAQRAHLPQQVVDLRRRSHILRPMGHEVRESSPAHTLTLIIIF